MGSDPAKREARGDDGPRVVIVMGPAGAGKTTVGSALARALGWAFHDADDYHAPESRARMQAGHALTDEERAPWLGALAVLVARAVATETPIVLACSALRQRYRRALVTAAAADRVRFVHLDAPAAVLASRLATRADHFFPPRLLTTQLAALEEPGADEPAPVLTLDATQPVDALVQLIRAELLRPFEIRKD